MIPEAGGAETNFGESPRRGGHYGKLRRRKRSEQFFGTRESDNAVNILDFGTLHPAIFRKMNRGIGVREKFTNRSEAGTTMSVFDGIVWVHIVLDSPAGPDASDSGSGVDEDAIHVEEQGRAGNLGH